MGPRVAIAVALLAVATSARARPAPDPLKPPADPKPRPATAAQRASAKAHYARALKLYGQRKLEAARTELELARKAAPDSDFDFAIARIDIELDQCDAAIPELEKFLETSHGANATNAARFALDNCKEKAAPPPPPPPPEPTAPPPAPAPAPHASRHWYRDWVGDAVVGAGVASGVASLLCYRAAVNDLDVADASMTLAEHAHHVDDAHTMRTYSLVFAGTGLALVTAGVVRYMRHDRHDEHRSIAVMPTSGGGMVTLSGSFQ